MKLAFDIDNTIVLFDNNRDYANFKPDTEMVSMINKLYDDGHTIVLYTARGMTSCGPNKISIEIVLPLIENLEKIGLKYHELVTHKISYDFLIDDKTISPDTFKNLMNSNSFSTHQPYVPSI